MTKAELDGKESLLSLAEAQAYLGIRSRKTLLKFIRSGQLSAFKLGGTRWRIKHSDIEQLIKTGHSH